MALDSKCKTIVYVYLENEGTDSWRPVEAIQVEGQVYELSADLNPDELEEEWQFLPGSRVVCEVRSLCGSSIEGVRSVLVAVRMAD